MKVLSTKHLVMEEKMRGFELRKRDLEILYYISSQNFATVNEIYESFFNSKKETKNHYRRLNQLVRAEYLQKLRAPQNYFAGYKITLKGQNTLRVSGYKITPHIIQQDVYTGKYEHDLLVYKIKNILLRSPIVENFIPEYQIAGKILGNSRKRNEYQKGDKIPDGLFCFRLQNKLENIAFELELSLKSKRRYENIFAKHMLSRSWDGIFYVVKDETMREKLLSFIKEIKRKDFLLRGEKRLNRIYFSLLDEVLEKKLDALFMNSEVEFSLNSLEKKSKEKRETK